MKITHITTTYLNYPLERAVYDANYTMSTKRALLVAVRTDEGMTGIGPTPDQNHIDRALFFSIL